MNMFKATKAKNIDEYVKSLPTDRQNIINYLHKLIVKTSPSFKPNFLYNMPGYGSFEYKNYKNEVINWPTIAVASQKDYVSIYICSISGNEYLAEKYKPDLGKVSVGKSCIRFKKLEDLNIETLKKIIKLAEKNPGLTPK